MKGTCMKRNVCSVVKKRKIKQHSFNVSQNPTFIIKEMSNFTSKNTRTLLTTLPLTAAVLATLRLKPAVEKAVLKCEHKFEDKDEVRTEITIRFISMH
jgi:hypothetical protein